MVVTVGYGEVSANLYSYNDLKALSRSLWGENKFDDATTILSWLDQQEYPHPGEYIELGTHCRTHIIFCTRGEE